MTDRAATRLLTMAKSGIIDGKNLQVFALGGSVRKLSEDILTEWIEFLLARKDDYQSVALALNLYCFYYLYSGTKRTLPEELTMKMLTHEKFLGKIALSEDVANETQYALGGDIMIEYYWTELGKEFAREYPQKSLILAKKMVENIGNDSGIIQSRSQAIEVLTGIATKYPIEIWKEVSKYLGPPIDKRAYHIEQWLHGPISFTEEGKGFLSMVPSEEIFKWVDENVKERAWYLAYFVPKEPFSTEGKICPREVLVRYGNRDDVRKNLIANFSSEVFSGSSVLHFQNKKEKLLKFKETETNENVKLWIDEYIAQIDEEIRQNQVGEEREF